MFDPALPALSSTLRDEPSGSDSNESRVEGAGVVRPWPLVGRANKLAHY